MIWKLVEVFTLNWYESWNGYSDDKTVPKLSVCTSGLKSTLSFALPKISIFLQIISTSTTNYSWWKHFSANHDLSLNQLNQKGWEFRKSFLFNSKNKLILECKICSVKACMVNVLHPKLIIISSLPNESSLRPVQRQIDLRLPTYRDWRHSGYVLEIYIEVKSYQNHVQIMHKSFLIFFMVMSQA